MQRDFFNRDAEVLADAQAAYKEVSERAEVAETTTPTEPVESKTESTPTEPKTSDKPRDEGGRFTKKTTETVETKPDTTDKTAQTLPKSENDKGATDDKTSPVDDKTQAAAAPTGGPPSSWSVQAKAAWEALPPHVRADILKRETEMGDGLSALRDYKDLKPYAEMAKQHNTTIPQFLDRAIGIERLLRQDLAVGIAQITKNFGLNQQSAGQLFLRMAQQLGATPGASPTPPIGGQPAPNGQSPDPLMDLLRQSQDPLRQEVLELRNMLQQRQVADRNAAEKSLAQAYEAFKSDPANRYFSNVEETMALLMEMKRVPMSGNHSADFKAAYDMAVKLHPEIQQALIEQRLADEKEAQRKKEQEAADRAKAASRSVTGSPAPGTTVKETQQRYANSEEDVRADVIRAMRMSARA